MIFRRGTNAVCFSFPNVRLSLQTAFEKRLNCFGVTNGFGNSESAINMLANKAVDLSNYAVRTVKFSETEKILKVPKKLIDKKGMW